MATPIQQKTARILTRISDGEPEAAAELVPHVYDELRNLAASYFRNQNPGHTLQPTALVHEAYLRLVDQSSAHWRDRSHFIAIAATAMRQILVDHFRRRHAAKRGGDWQKISLDRVGAEAPRAEIDLLALDEALKKLAALDERQARVVELRYFGGLTVDEVTEVLGISRTTVEGEWRAARAWLASELRKGTDP